MNEGRMGALNWSWREIWGGSCVLGLELINAVANGTTHVSFDLKCLPTMEGDVLF